MLVPPPQKKKKERGKLHRTQRTYWHRLKVTSIALWWTCSTHGITSLTSQTGFVVVSSSLVFSKLEKVDLLKFWNLDSKTICTGYIYELKYICIVVWTLYQIRERGISVRHVCGSNDISNVCARVNDVRRIRVEAMLICLNIYLIQKQIYRTIGYHHCFA